MRKNPNKKKVSPMEIVPSGMPMDRLATDILEMCRLLNVQKTRTTPYHPQSDGMVERFNLNSHVEYICARKSKRLGYTHIPYVMMAYRSAEHKSTGFTPNMLMLGRETSLPVDLMYEMPETMKEESPNHWAWTLREKLERAHSLMRENLETAMNRQKMYHDMKLSWEKFKPGDKVFFHVAETEKNILSTARMRKKRSQTLSFEDAIIGDESEFNDIESEDTNEVECHEIDVVEELNPDARQKRVRKQPKWLQDYET
ncbi:uncharacterized protein LOC134280459 [Saccostrea cucullata]|uniref:uncharacterized protein LOC134280459 n=1 Tax=Saccostrea cuccullata TaxID=36930 RepID=UPI002ED3A809